MDTSKIAVSTWLWGSDSIEQVERSFLDISSVGFQNFEAVYTTIKTFNYDTSAYNELLNKYNLMPVSFYFMLPVLQNRKAFFADLEKNLKFVQSLKVQSVCLSGTPGRPQSKNDFDTELGMISDFIKLAEFHGIEVAVHPHYLSYITFENEFSEIFDRMPNAYFCPDTAHLVLAKLEPEYVFDKYADRIRFVHLKDIAYPAGDTFPDGPEAFNAFCDLGEGNIDFMRLTEILLKNNYSGIYCSEFDNPTNSLIKSTETNFEYLKNRL